MPTKRVRESERKRCAQACENCKLRKQRCDGLRPCRRCTRRGLARDCQSSTTRYPLLASSLPSPDPDHFRKGTPPPGGPDPERVGETVPAGDDGEMRRVHAGSRRDPLLHDAGHVVRNLPGQIAA